MEGAITIPSSRGAAIVRPFVQAITDEHGKPSFYELSANIEIGGKHAPADDFVRYLERATGGIEQLDLAMLDVALTALAVRPLEKLSVNMSAVNAFNPEWWGKIRGPLNIHSLEAGRLFVECTEAHRIGRGGLDINTALILVGRLQEKGGRIHV